MSSQKNFKWRKWNNIIHRDLGYLCVGLTVIYAVSGVAVNHVADWKGKKGITGRGAWWTGAGVLIPAVFLWLYL